MLHRSQWPFGLFRSWSFRTLLKAVSIAGSSWFFGIIHRGSHCWIKIPTWTNPSISWQATVVYFCASHFYWKGTTSHEGLRLRLLIAGVPFVASHATCAGIIVRILVIQFICIISHRQQHTKNRLGLISWPASRSPSLQKIVLVCFGFGWVPKIFSTWSSFQTFLRPPAIAGEPLDPCAKELRGYLYKPFER